MRRSFFGVLGRFTPLLFPLACVLSALLAGSCIFSPDPAKLPTVPSAETVPYDSVTTDPAELQIDLFEPYLDRRIAAGGQSALQLAYPVRIREHGTGRVVEYHYSRRGYGSWNAERERQLHLFLLRSFFFHPGVFDDAAAASLGLDSLYARAALLDHYTRHLDSAAAAEYRRQSRTTVRPRVIGIQIRVNDTEDTVSLMLVAPGSPAHEAGLRRGMPILAVNDSAVTGDSALARFVRFVDADTLTVALTVGTPQGPRTETIVRDTATFPTIITDSLGGAGYVSILSFTSSTVGGGSTYSEFKAALKATGHFPATILDLRGNGGGSLFEVLRMCDEVLSGGPFIRLIERNIEDGASQRLETTYRAKAGGVGEGRDYVLLADSGSASASEIFIAALRENLQTPFMGTHTYGKGIGQASFDTPGGGMAIVTYGSVRTAAGANYHGIGLSPTHPSGAKPDAMLAQAAALAVPNNLARRGAGSFDAKATEIDWNRRQALRPDVVEWGLPGDARGKEER
jgi:carboxyl-terminal processing protease